MCVCVCRHVCKCVCVVCKQNCKHCINAIMLTRLLQTAHMYYYTICNANMGEGAASKTQHQQQTSLFPSVKSEDSQWMEGGRDGGKTSTRPGTTLIPDASIHHSNEHPSILESTSWSEPMAAILPSLSTASYAQPTGHAHLLDVEGWPGFARLFLLAPSLCQSRPTPAGGHSWCEEGEFPSLPAYWIQALWRMW